MILKSKVCVVLCLLAICCTPEVRFARAEERAKEPAYLSYEENQIKEAVELGPVQGISRIAEVSRALQKPLTPLGSMEIASREDRDRYRRLEKVLRFAIDAMCELLDKFDPKSQKSAVPVWKAARQGRPDHEFLKAMSRKLMRSIFKSVEKGKDDQAVEFLMWLANNETIEKYLHEELDPLSDRASREQLSEFLTELMEKYGKDPDKKPRLFIEAFMSAANWEFDESVVKMAGKVAAKAQDTRIDEAVMRFLKGASESAARFSAYCKPLLREATRSERPHIRILGCSSLSSLGDVRDVLLLEPLLADPDPNVRFQAAASISAIVGWKCERGSEEKREAFAKDVQERVEQLTTPLRALEDAIKKGVEDFGARPSIR